MGGDLAYEERKREKSEAADRADDATAPLIVDLDGTLIHSDILVESAFKLLERRPFLLFMMVFVLLSKGKAGLKNYIAERVDLDVRYLPYNSEVMSLIKDAREDERSVYLASASHEKYVLAIAEHLDCFDGWFASDNHTNLSGTKKRDLLVAKFGEQNFDYIGNAKVDLKIWSVARQCIGIDLPRGVARKLLKLAPDSNSIRTRPSQVKTWIKLLRVHQWAKNGLVFVPLITSQSLYTGSILASVGSFFAFSIAASSIYIINDAVDLEADRQHPSKQFRPLAAGTVPIASAILAVPIMLSGALIGAWLINPIFFAVLVGYLCLTTAYTFSLKRKLLVDIVALASLYTIRVIGGAAAISVAVSEWLLAFSVFVFACLALIKRYTELVVRFDADLPDPTNRNYRKADLPIVATLAAASGFNAVTVFALYISDDRVSSLYANPQLLWLICPMLLYWLGRALMLAHRRSMHDDPIVFALKDRNSRLTGLAAGAVVLAAIFEIPFL